MPPKEFIRPRATSPEVLRLVEAAAEMDRQQLQQQQQHQHALQQQQQQQQSELDADDVELQRALEASLRESAASPSPPAIAAAEAAAAAADAAAAPRQLSAAEFIALLPEDDDLTDLLQPPPPRSSSNSTFPLSRGSSSSSSSKKLPEDRFRVPPEWIEEEERRGCCCCCRVPPSCSSSSRSAGSAGAAAAATATPEEPQQQQQERWKCCSCVAASDSDAAAAAAADGLTEEEQRASFEASTMPLQQQQLRELLLLLFGEGSGREIDKEDLGRWMAHPIAFAADWPEAAHLRGAALGEGAAGGAAAAGAAGAAASCEEWGLVQVHGGPCGVLAALQCLVLRSLLFSRFRAAKRLQHEQQQQQQQQEQQQQQLLLRLHPCSLQRQHALAEAVAAVLYQCTEGSVYTVAALSPPRRPPAAAAAGTSAAAAAAAEVDSLQVQVREIVGIAQVMRFYFAHQKVLLAAPGAALSLLASVVLTRGPSKVRRDMDPPSRALVGVYGHCAQESLNLLLQGAASSNVCDGATMIGEACLGGAYKRPLVGFLSEMEVLRYCEVGSRFKAPLFPLWVVGSGNHYTTLFSTDPAAAEMPSQALLEAESRWAFQVADPGNSLLLQQSSLPHVFAALGLPSSCLEEVPSADGVVLFGDWNRWFISYRKKQKKVQGPHVEPPETFHLFLYDGQIPPGPGVCVFLINTTSKGQQKRQPQTEAVERLLRTRWPQALVSSVQL